MSYYVEMVVLVVRDDELNVGDDKVTSSEVAEVGERGKTLWGADPVSRPWFPGDGGSKTH
jgi:hypothetical protein